ncbi:MAG: WxL domain-containing protein [Carnobacterium sp.]|uniref:WxL domain-containing protein n=1 Tax=Carnobacterium sp. TaxID=48221 RepID=UPI002FC987B0
MKTNWKSITLVSTILLASLGSATIVDAAKEQTIDGRADVQFKAPETRPVDPSDPEDPDPELIVPVDPEDPNPPVYPGGDLRLNHIPTISFGINDIAAAGATYNAQFEKVIDKTIGGTVGKKKASFVEVADETGLIKGWQVTVSSNGVFKSAAGNEILGAITLKSGSIRGLDGMDELKDKFPTANQNIVIGNGSNNASVEVMNAAAGKGMNKWQVRYGDSELTTNPLGDDKTVRNPNVTLTVPKGQILLVDQKYTAKVVWSLAQGL